MLVRQRLKDLGLTQEKFGEMLEPTVTQGVISQWVRGKERIPPNRHKEIARILSISVDQIENPSPFVRTPEQINEWRDLVMMNTPNIFAMAVLSSFPAFMQPNGECHLNEEAIAELIPTMSVERIMEVWPAVLNSPFIERVGRSRWCFRLQVPEEI